jgi:hypothetical protein
MIAGLLGDDEPPSGVIDIEAPRRQARFAGLFYFITFLTALFSEVVVRGNLVDTNDAVLTAHNIMASESLYRVGFACDLISGLAYLVVTLLLYHVFKPVSAGLSLLAAAFSVVGIAIGNLATIGNFAALLLLSGGHYLATFNAAQLQSMSLLSIKLAAYADNISLTNFGVYCILLGYLIDKSTFMPRALGVLMAIAGFGLLANSFAGFLWPAFAHRFSPYFLALDALGEGAFTLWLLFKGVNVAQWWAKAGSAAR